MKQKLLELKSEVNYSASTFVITNSNKNMYNFLLEYKKWPKNRLLIIGGRASGKTHMVSIWSSLSEAQLVDGSEFCKIDLNSISCNVAIDNIECVENEESLFALINIMDQKKFSLLMTCGTDDSFYLPDLKSRLESSFKFCIKELDETLIQGLLAKRLNDLQLCYSAKMISYVSKNIRRSYAAMDEFIEDLNFITKLYQKKPSIPIVKSILFKQCNSG